MVRAPASVKLVEPSSERGIEQRFVLCRIAEAGAQSSTKIEKGGLHDAAQTGNHILDRLCAYRSPLSDAALSRVLIERRRVNHSQAAALYTDTKHSIRPGRSEMNKGIGTKIILLLTIIVLGGCASGGTPLPVNSDDKPILSAA